MDIDPKLLEQLHYKNCDGQTPLHIALEAKNNRIVNLILDYMSNIDYAAVGLIKDIMKNLISFKGFEQYLIECPFQSLQMLNKQTLVIKKAEDKEIISIN